MTLATNIVSDLDTMLGDWGDTITVVANTYNGLYDAEFAEEGGMQGFAPVFTAKTSDVSAASIARGTAVTVTSVIASITNKAFTVADVQDMRDGTTKLLLSE